MGPPVSSRHAVGAGRGRTQRCIRRVAGRLPARVGVDAPQLAGRVGGGRAVGHAGPRGRPAAGAVNAGIEERFLFLLLLLRQPRLRMVYVTSMPIDAGDRRVLPGAAAGGDPQPRPRAALARVGRRPQPGPLTEKLLERPRVLADIAALIPDRSRSHLIPYRHDRARAGPRARAGHPHVRRRSEALASGTKTGCRRLFAEAGCATRWGGGPAHDRGGRRRRRRLRQRRPEGQQAIVKLNEGVSGAGNALVDLSGLPAAARRPSARQLPRRGRTMQLEGRNVAHEAYLAKFAERGGIVEERIVGDEVRSPSVQLRGDARTVRSSCSRRTTSCWAGRAGRATSAAASRPTRATHRHQRGRDEDRRRLAREGVIGRFAVDFVSVREPAGAWTAYAIELNLRKGGTTHPFLTLQFLTDGGTTADRAVPHAAGDEKHLVATDHLEALRYVARARRPVRHRRAARPPFRQSPSGGVVFHMISCLTEHGRVG